MARIEATGRYMPEKVVKNDFFAGSAPMFKSFEEYFTGYEERRHAGGSDTGLSMAVNAARDAFSVSDYTPEDVDMIVGCIIPNENLYGEDINLVQHELGCKNASVFPVNTCCSSFLTALNLAESHIATGKKKCVLIVIVANWIRHGLDTSQPNYIFAGDGAAAVIVDDSGDCLIDVYERNNSTPAIFESMLMKSPVFTGKQEHFVITEPEGVSTARDLILAPIEVASVVLDRNPDVQIDKILMHQSGIKMMKMWLDKLSLPFDKVRHTLNLFANMSAAGLPVSLDYWVKEGGIERGDTLLFFTPATGGHYMAVLWKY